MVIKKRLCLNVKLKDNRSIVVTLKDGKTPLVKYLQNRIHGKKSKAITFSNETDTVLSVDSFTEPSTMGILEITPNSLTFKEACLAMAHNAMEERADEMRRAIKSYSLLIYGLPEYTPEDLELAVFFFLEEKFGIRIYEFELCVELTDGDINFVGVVFDRREIPWKIFYFSDDVLKDTGIHIELNHDMMWILEGLSSKWGKLEENLVKSV